MMSSDLLKVLKKAKKNTYAAIVFHLSKKRSFGKLFDIFATLSKAVLVRLLIFF